MIAITVAFALLLIGHIVLDDGTNYGYLLIILSAGMGLWLYQAVKLKRKHAIFFAVFWTLLVIYSAVMVILDFIR